MDNGNAGSVPNGAKLSLLFIRFIFPVMGTVGDFFIFAAVFGKDGKGLGSSFDGPWFAASGAYGELISGDHEQ